MNVAGIIDRAIAAVAPSRALARVEARARMRMIEDTFAKYDGASRSHRMAGRHISSTSANAEISASLTRLRDVSRDMRRNNAVAGNCVSVIGANVVGTGIVPTIGGVRGVREGKKLKALIKAHLETTAIDFDRRHDLYGLQRLATETVVESGEVLIVRYRAPASLGLPLPFQIRVLDPDYLDTSKDGRLSATSAAYQGIEVDAQGRRVAYWIHDEHPGGAVNWRLPTSRRVPAEDVLHIYRQDRPGQMRGVPWIAPVIRTLWDLDQYEDAELMRQKIAACFAVFFTGTAPQSNLATQNSKSKSGNPVEYLEPGIMQHLPSGDVKFATPPGVQGYSDFVKANYRKVAAGYGVPYELATGDLSNVSFISGRLGLLEFNRRVDLWRWQMMIPHFCDGIGRWFLDAAQIVIGADLSGVDFKWTPPRREMMEPTKEIAAARDAIRAGLSTRSEEQRRLGYEPEEMDAENAADNLRADQLELKFDSDGRFPANEPIATRKDPDDEKSTD